ncbi:nucleoside hydrolase [Paenibacillus sp. FSL H7-0326]|uniref:nucleoside hydrolase n=1 Tax=Paenibacillus sp. FSL H7-0326 TaxID=1921144 RepID=UPI00096E971E|nr:nucleoside hydrolase [Paenibacillus sp. FSL H7-0326]OMC71432.1 nucleoside hydrolase [Paenibacillus sp. FSL H7-0326]
MQLPFDVPEWRKIRLMINTDAKNEADDQYAIVHALLTPRFKVKGIIAAQFENSGRLTGRENTMQKSYEEIEKVLSLMGLEGEVPVYAGAEKPLSDEMTPEPSDGAVAIVREALADDPSPFYVIFLGPLTDLASAYLMEPSIADKVKVVWIGGGPYPNGGWEHNLFNDIHAANVVFESPIELWQVPSNVYSTMRVSLAELMYKVKPYGKIGEYLYEQLIDFNNSVKFDSFPKGEMWSLGDSPAVSLLLDDHEHSYELKPAPRITQDMYYVHDQNERMIRVYHFVDPRFTLEDMFAKLH